MIASVALLLLTSAHALAPATRAAIAPQDVIRDLFGSGIVDPDSVAAACAEDVIWDDRCRRRPAVGRRAVRSMMKRKFGRRGCRLAVERVAEAGPNSNLGGFCWRREAEKLPGVGGLRGITLIEVDGDGAIARVTESSEPVLKPGSVTAKLFAKAVEGIPAPERSPYAERTPTSASDLVRYIWREAYPGGADPSVFADLCADGIIYEDLNYKRPFLGRAAVEAMVTEYDLSGVEWELTEQTTGDRSCCFRWAVRIKGEEVADGISFYDGNPVTYVRDIPTPLMKPPPLLSLAAALRPRLRLFRGHRSHWCYGDDADGRPICQACEV